MADDSLKDPVVVSALGLSASSLPRGISPAYERYILAQVIDFTNVAGKANEAGKGAYDAQQKNDEQDAELADHENRIAALRIEVDDHEIRITANASAISALSLRVTTAEGNIATLQTNLSSLTTRVTSAESNITNLQTDYVSKSAASLQTISSPFNVSTSYSVNGTTVVGTRKTGWTASTGTDNRASMNADFAYTVGTTYSQSEVQSVANGLRDTRRRLKSLEADMRAHGLIDG